MTKKYLELELKNIDTKINFLEDQAQKKLKFVAQNHGGKEAKSYYLPSSPSVINTVHIQCIHFLLDEEPS